MFYAVARESYFFLFLPVWYILNASARW
jgi:hypothetical protein